MVNRRNKKTCVLASTGKSYYVYDVETKKVVYGKLLIIQILNSIVFYHLTDINDNKYRMLTHITSERLYRTKKDCLEAQK